VKPESSQYGIPYPGTYLVDTQGKVVAKYFEQDMRERISASAILDASDRGSSAAPIRPVLIGGRYRDVPVPFL
jgi:hypothetical protein